MFLVIYEIQPRVLKILAKVIESPVILLIPLFVLFSIMFPCTEINGRFVTVSLKFLQK